MRLSIAFLIPKRYEAIAQLMPPMRNPSTFHVSLIRNLREHPDGGLGMLAGDLLGVKSTGALFVGVLRSRTVQDRIIDVSTSRRCIATGFRSKAREELAERHTAIAEDRKSGIITIAVTDTTLNRAAAIAGAYVEELNRL